VRSHLADILSAILLIEQFMEGMDLDGNRLDEKNQAAVERKMLIISAAAIRMQNDAESLCSGVPWRDIRGIGNWLRHQYDRVEVETVWNAIQDDLPSLKTAVEKALAPPGPVPEQ